jgi:hypothetical protein
MSCYFRKQTPLKLAILFGHRDGPLPEGTCHFMWSHGWLILFGHMDGPLSEGTCHFIWLHGWPILFGHMDGSFYLITWMTHFMWSNG